MIRSQFCLLLFAGLLAICAIANADLPETIDDLPIQNITPTDEIFSVFIDGIPSISASEYTLSVTGMVDRPLTLTLEQVRGFRRAVVMSTLECLGNRAVPGLIANATWTGVPLRTVLDMAGVGEGAEGVIEYGEDGFVSALDLARASRADTILAYEVNGEILPATLGFPVRVIAPGVYGLRQVMWLRRLEVMGAGFQDYVVNTLHLPPNPEVVINSELQYPPGGTVFTAGEPFQIFGYAVVDGLVGVATVELSFDGLQTWLPARLYRNKNPSAWVLWGIEWVPRSLGPLEVSIRATDMNGQSQPVEDNDFSNGYSPIQTVTFDVVAKSGDLTNDGLVNWKDLFFFMQEWQRGMNQVPPSAGLPVPPLPGTQR